MSLLRKIRFEDGSMIMIDFARVQSVRFDSARYNSGAKFAEVDFSFSDGTHIIHRVKDCDIVELTRVVDVQLPGSHELTKE